MSESNTSERKTQLKANSDDVSDQPEARKHSETGGCLADVERHLKLLSLREGSKESKFSFEMMDYCIPKWSSLEPGQKIFFILRELSSRSGIIEKKILTKFKSHITSVGISLRDWTKEQYETAIEKLHDIIENTRESPLVNPPMKVNGTWMEWLGKFMSYVLFEQYYTWEEVEVEFLNKKTIYPQIFLEVWRQQPQDTFEAFRRLSIECVRIDEIEQQNEGKGNYSKDAKKKRFRRG
ncbi:hypothetical protein NEAUS03_2129 [Nematocida ausubeli]|nr:hypothetical protein NEAUS03_2129 [Nematocida ausubeli]